MNIWRFGQLWTGDLQTFYAENKLAFYWMDPTIDYSKARNIRSERGWTCIEPWVNEVKKNDLIFLVSRYNYAGIARVLDDYKYSKYDFNINNRILPGLPVEFLHKLNKPLDHNFNITHTNPRVFSRINHFGFRFNQILQLLKLKYQIELKSIIDYLNNVNNGVSNTNKISRVCWNIHDWKKPSGTSGKNKSEDTFEGENGYGYEEWLNVKNRQIDGFHYSFLQTLGSGIHFDKIYNITLIVNDTGGKRFIIGFIKNAICIDNEESKEVYKIYKEKGWLDEMIKEIDSIGGNIKEFKRQQPEYSFNIKFKPENLNIYKNFYEIIDDPITTYRYKLLDGFIEDLNLINNEDDSSEEGNLKSTDKVTRCVNTEVVFDALHNKMQNNLFNLLKKDKNYEFVQIEKGRVDLKAKTKDGKWHYYEIKTYGSCKKSVRYAIGQIMEYAFWPSLRKAEELIIVSENDADLETRKYMEHLRTNFELPVYYQSFKLPDILGEKV